MTTTGNNMTTDVKIKQLEKKIAQLEERISYLEAAERIKQPFQPNPWPLYPIQPRRACPTCGLDLTNTMGYCCPNANCPCGMGPIMCSNV